jgi:hypothetical protein
MSGPMKILTPGTVELVILSPAPVSTHVVKRADRAVRQRPDWYDLCH